MHPKIQNIMNSRKGKTEDPYFRLLKRVCESEAWMDIFNFSRQFYSNHECVLSRPLHKMTSAYKMSNAYVRFLFPIA